MQDKNIPNLLLDVNIWLNDCMKCIYQLFVPQKPYHTWEHGTGSVRRHKGEPVVPPDGRCAAELSKEPGDLWPSSDTLPVTSQHATLFLQILINLL